MCTPWTMTWHVRWRVRNWTSCFSACRLPLDDHELDSSPQVAVRKNTAFDDKKDNSTNPMHNKNLSRSSKSCNKRRQQNNQIGKEKEGAPIGNRVDDSSWSLSADDECIVFCFRDDGAFDVVKDHKSVKYEARRGVDGEHKNSRPVNRKKQLQNFEDAEQVSDGNIHEKRSNAEEWDTDQHDQDCVTILKKDEKKENKYLSRNQHTDSIIRVCPVEEIEDCGMVSAESRDSNQSEGSIGSFAFPVLGWEWVGSPVQMPKSEGLHLMKQKVRSVRFQSCEF
ncbi:BREAKING OF ASYMMETRY IN THE STOMATAL LINEAGE [Spatholobus suberectus]|nr:BREAKING OF ASYMMETRY IN THE STOMATAL LINEAGE [Spatholobus suberectus]